MKRLTSEKLRKSMDARIRGTADLVKVYNSIEKKRPHKGETLPILGDGFVRFIDVLGTDRRVVEAARISYRSPSKGPDEDQRLLRYLFRKRHTSPFEQCNITFNIKMPIFIMRQLVRHRTFRLNEVSSRYTKLPSEMYRPKAWKGQAVKNKQGSAGKLSQQKQDIAHNYLNTGYVTAYRAYEALLELGVSKEQARIVLPVGIFTEIYLNVDLHNLMHFLRLRLDKHAQAEIRELAQAMYDIARRLFPWSFDAFETYKMRMVKVTKKGGVK